MQHGNGLGFLPTSRTEMKQRAWDQLDFILVTGDAYVDHPSFGTALIGRLLESRGYKVGVIAQPDWKSEDDFTALGAPRLAFLVSGGAMDSMVNNYTVRRRPRREDVFSPGGVGGKRPDRAVLVYCTKLRECFKGIPLILGGLEASLRRLAHYDFWSNKLRSSILLDSKADLLVYGMGENQVLEIAERLNRGEDISSLNNIRGTVVVSKELPGGNPGRDYHLLPDPEEMRKNKRLFAESFMIQHRNTDPIVGKILIEKNGKRFVLQNPPALALSVEMMDEVPLLPYMRTWHPRYDKEGGVPAIREVKFSITSTRGCFGGCSFCALTFHQGRRIQARSHESIYREAVLLSKLPDFKGYIHDVGGPTANFRKPACKKQVTKGVCPGRQCLFPEPCPNLDVDHKDFLGLLIKIRKIPGVKKVFIRSGIRFDYLIEDNNDSFFRELCKHHISGRLKVAPEHIDDAVLAAMGKPQNHVYQAFVKKYEQINREMGKPQKVVPYFISSHPGSDLKAAIALAEYHRDHGLQTEQVQDYYPTPGTLSTAMYFSGIDPRTMKPVYIPRDEREKNMQRALLQYFDVKNHRLVREALTLAKRTDLIGFGPDCLVPPHGASIDRFEMSRPHTNENSWKTAPQKKSGPEKKDKRRRSTKQNDGEQKNGQKNEQSNRNRDEKGRRRNSRSQDSGDNLEQKRRPKNGRGKRKRR